MRDRRFAEHCQYGDIVGWPSPPTIRLGADDSTAPSAIGQVSIIIGPEPYTALARFYVGANWEAGDPPNTEPLVIVRGQPLKILQGRK